MTSSARSGAEKFPDVYKPGAVWIIAPTELLNEGGAKLQTTMVSTGSSRRSGWQ